MTTAPQEDLSLTYSSESLRGLKTAFLEQRLHRPLRTRRHDPGDELTYAVRGVAPGNRGQVRLRIERFVGGGFAGQVYKVRILHLDLADGPIPGLVEGGSYALKILVPPSGAARLFRNLLYGIAFQGYFAPQVNPTAARAGALWQKFIRWGAASGLDGRNSVVDILATLVDLDLGACGEISEWVDGRPWRFEVDDNLDARRRWKPGGRSPGTGSPEYRAKKRFMARLVRLLHDMGAPELARQYEWWTGKSQPNVLKRLVSDPDPESGHVAVDFRAGLALLPFLPMSPADVKLILRGAAAGRWVQFDRGDPERLRGYIREHRDDFKGLEDAFPELALAEREYRESLPDFASHRLRLLHSGSLWRSILRSHLEGLVIRGHIDREKADALKGAWGRTAVLYGVGVLPFLGRFLRRLYGHSRYRNHYRDICTRSGYLVRVWKARRAEALLAWQRSGRVTAERGRDLNLRPLRFAAHLPLSLLPPGLHRFLSDGGYARARLDGIFVRPLRLYFKSEAREAWLRDTVSKGERSGMLTAPEAERIRSRIREPFIQKYLKSLAVHVCTVPVTQIVSVLVAVIYVRLHPDLSWPEASLRAGLILGLFQVTPISPGSLVRGLYVTYLVVRERNFNDYRLAFSLSFFKYIGYLAFPIQMAYRYPDLARFMAGHWATGAVHIVPVFGERGALLEHAVFDLFYNYPLTIRRRLRLRRDRRSGRRPRSWHVAPVTLGGLGILIGIDAIFALSTGLPPGFRQVWWAAIWVPVLCAGAVTAWAGGTSLGGRLTLAVTGNGCLGALYALGRAVTADRWPIARPAPFPLTDLLSRNAGRALWLAFLFALLAAAVVLVIETRRLRARPSVPA